LSSAGRRKNLFCDVAFQREPVRGVKVDASSCFLHIGKKEAGGLTFSANYLYGTPIDYVNVKYLDADNPGPNRYTKDVDIKFIDITTQHIHEHHVGAGVYMPTLT
jgi:hypothetical protein